MCGISCIGGISLSILLEGCGTATYYAQHDVKDSQIIVKKTEFNIVKDGKTEIRKYVLLKTEKLNFPICVYKIDEEKYNALLMECTHKSCELQPHGDYLICPCHGSEFSNTGAVQNPPAETNLKTFKIKTDHESIFVQL